jgi:hypothetical protein
VRAAADVLVVTASSARGRRGSGITQREERWRRKKIGRGGGRGEKEVALLVAMVAGGEGDWGRSKARGLEGADTARDSVAGG